MAQQSEAAEVLELAIRVDAGAVDRRDTLVTAVLQPQDAVFTRTAGELATAVTLTETEGPSPGRRVPCQVGPGGTLAWVATGLTPAGTSRAYRCAVERVHGGRIEPRAGAVAVRLAGDHLWFTRDGALLARYVYLGNWKPYFWPIMLPEGNVVRGSSAEHQHQTGLFLAYGGHGGDGTTNIWSDWDEPPYGPDGKMVHQRFELAEGGPVYGRFIQRVVYTRADGPKLLDEARDIRVTPLPNGDLVFDFDRRPTEPAEPKPGSLILGLRVADTMRLVDLRKRDEQGNAQRLEQPGTLTGATELKLQNVVSATYRTDGPWMDWSGPVGKGVAGLAFFDNPANPEYGQGVTAGGYGCMTMSHHCPAGARDVVFRYRVVAHSGDAAEARIAERFLDYGEPAPVEVEVIRRPPPKEEPH